jgi:hypothetical protein
MPQLARPGSSVDLGFQLLNFPHLLQQSPPSFMKRVCLGH